MGPPEKVMSGLVFARLLEAEHGRSLRIHSAEQVANDTVFAGRIKRLAESDSEIQFIRYDEAYPPGFEDMQRRVPDVSRVRRLLGWTPTRSLDQVLLAVIEYERNRPDAEPN